LKIIEKLLMKNPYSRPGRQLAACKGIIFHYTGMANQRAETTWEYFENVCSRGKIFACAHYIIDLNGDIYHAIPDNEIAYHCGSETPDPKSGRIYTDWARDKFGFYASDPTKASPNFCTIGIELCIDAQWNFTSETLKAAVELTAKLLEENNLTVDEIGHHKKVVGWKDCPLPWVKVPALFDEFKERVKARMGLLL
jgi:N-acetylmuramoyl-L-alanine amidase